MHPNFASDIQARIDRYLDAVEMALATAGHSRDERRGITDHLQAEIMEKLLQRYGAQPTADQVESLIAQLRTPRSFAESRQAEPSSQPEPPPLASSPPPIHGALGSRNDPCQALADLDFQVKLLAVLRIAYSAMGVLAAIVLFLVSISFQWIPHTSWIGLLLHGFGVMSLVFAVPGILGGIGLLQRWNWARYLCLVVGFFDLFSFPVGTALGGYSFWVLLPGSTRETFAPRLR